MKSKIFIALVLIIAFGAAYYYFDVKNSEVLPALDGAQSTSTVPIATSTAPGTVIIGPDGGEYTVEAIPPESSLSFPSLERPVNIPSVFTGEARVQMQMQLDKVIAILKKDRTDSNAWLDLALYRKMIHDYEGAREIWEFLITAGSTSSVIYANLGELYHLYLKDFPKSEFNYKKAIAGDPARAALYLGLHELYRYSYKQDSTLAADVLKEGIKKNPNAIELFIALARYYVSQKNKTDATTYFEKAISLSRALHNESQAKQLELELAKL